MTTPISSDNLSNNHTAHIADRLESLSVTDEPEHIVQTTPPSFAAACQEFEEAIRVECEAFTRDLTSDLVSMGQRLVAKIEERGHIGKDVFAPLRETLDKGHAEMMEQLKVLRDRLDRMS